MANNKGKGSLTQRKDGIWQACVVINGKRKYFYSKNKTDARKKMNDFLRSENQIYNSQRFDNYIENYILTYKYKHIKDSSYDRIDSIFRNHIKNTKIGMYRMDDISDMELQQYLNTLADTFSYSSAKKVYQLVRGCLLYAYRRGDINVDYGSLIRLPNEERFKAINPVETYSDREYEKLYNFIMNGYYECKHHARMLRYAPAYIIMFHTGLRTGEMLALKWDDVNFRDSEINITKSLSCSKNRSDNGSKYKNQITSVKTSSSRRVVPINTVVRDCLYELMERYENTNTLCDYVVSNGQGEFVKLRSFETKMERICEFVGVPYKGIHAIRHTFASNLIKKGINAKVVSELLGHTSVAFTLNRYVHTDNEQKKEALSLLEMM